MDATPLGKAASGYIKPNLDEARRLHFVLLELIEKHDKTLHLNDGPLLSPLLSLRQCDADKSLCVRGLSLAPGARVRLLSDKTLFQEAFSRFPNDAQNGLSPAKMKRLWQAAEVLHTYWDGTVSCRFDDGVQHDLPVEALEYTQRADESSHYSAHIMRSGTL